MQNGGTIHHIVSAQKRGGRRGRNIWLASAFGKSELFQTLYFPLRKGNLAIGRFWREAVVRRNVRSWRPAHPFARADF
jgi:hypothetical protein